MYLKNYNANFNKHNGKFQLDYALRAVLNNICIVTDPLPFITIMAWE